LVYPEKLGEIIQGIMVNPYVESGWLPEWSSPGHRDCMIGSNSASIIAEAYLKGITDFDIEKAYEGILNNSENEGPLSSVGRKGVEFYNNLGFIPYDSSVNENVARTLEYAYNDFSIWKLAEALNRPDEEVSLFRERADYYKNVFDNETNFMRGKMKDGNFQSPFRADAWGGAFTEGSSWHYTWSVLHDPKGLMNLMGGRIEFINKLDAVFETEPTSDFSYYGFKIHEIVEMELLNMGQYAHGNQPIQHAIYFYNYAREPWKTQEKIRYVLDNLYGPGPDGYCGDEDNGQTSAWYVFSALGFYPVAPVTGQYVIGSPLFEKAEISLSNGKKLKISSDNNSPLNFYIGAVYLNGSTYNNNWLAHSDLLAGTKIDLKMQSMASGWGSDESSVPYSMTGDK
jgi:predicted alpha-1,2-mannosidase